MSNLSKVLLFVLIIGLSGTFAPVFDPGGSGGGSSLTVKEGDNDPTVNNVSTISLTNGTLTDDGGGQVSITISGTGAPTDATYITQTANGTLSDEQALGALATGCMGSTTTTGVVATRTITGTANQISVANGDCSGNPTLSIPNNPTLPGTTTGTFSGNLTGNVTGNTSGTAGSLAANGANCSAGSAPLGVDASGAVESCTDYAEEPGSNGILAKTAANTITNRTITGTANEISVANGDGVAANPTISLPSTINLSAKTLRIPNGTELPGTCTLGDQFMDTDATEGQQHYLCTAPNAWTLQGDGGSGSAAFEDLTGGTNTTAALVIGTGASLTTSGSGTITATTSAALAANGGNCSAGAAPRGVDDAGAAENCTDFMEEPASTGLVVKSAANTAINRSIAGTANEIDVANGSAVSGNPTISLPTSIALAGKTVTVGNGGSITASGTGTITATGVAANSVALTTDTTGTYVDGVLTDKGLQLSGTEGADVGLIDCDNGEILKSNGSNEWACAADSTGGSPSFDTIASGSNTTATMTVGTGASLAPTGSGTITANAVAANTVALTTGTTGDYVDGVITDKGLQKTGTEGADLGLINCSNGEILKYNGTDQWVCSADSTGGSPTFDTIATGTNTTATMTMGTGGSLVLSGSGIVEASKFKGSGTTSDAVDLATGEVNGLLGSTNGGTGNGFTLFSGPASTEKTFTLPNASATILTTNTAVTIAQGGTNATSVTGNRCVRSNSGGTALESAAGDCVTSVDATGGVETASGSAITTTGTIRAAMGVRTVTDATDDIEATDRGGIIYCSHADGVDLSIAEAGTTGFEVKWYTKVMNIGVGDCVITPDTSTIDGAATSTLTTGKWTYVISDGTNYSTTGSFVVTEVDTLDTACTRGCEITSADSEENAFKITANDTTVNFFVDATDGFRVTTSPTADLTHWIPTDKNYVLFDEEDDTAVLTINPDSGGTGVASVAFRAGSVFTGVTLDAEGSNNTITTREERHFPVATCQNATASTNFDTPTSNAPAATCDTGTNTQKGYLAFDASTLESFQDSMILPTGWTGAIDIHFRWKAVATSGAVGWCAQLIRVPDAATSDPAFPALAAGNCVSDAAKGTTLQENTATISGVTCTDCAAGDHVYIRISRDAAGTAVTDDMANDAFLLMYGRTIRIAQ